MSEIDHDAFRAAIEREDAGLPLPSITPSFREPHEWPATGLAADGTADHAIASDDRNTRGHVNTAKGRWTHVRVPVGLAGRLARLADDMHAAYVRGRVELPGSMAERIPVWYVIQAALDEVESRRARSARPRTKKSV